MVNRAAVIERLESVNDPHVPVSLRRMGMLHAVEVAETGLVNVAVTVPCLGCPAAGILRNQVQEAVAELDGVRDVRVEIKWGANWRREDVDPEAHPMLRQFGLQI